MYYVGKFKIDSKIASLPIIWSFTEKGKSKCFWPVRDLETKLKKRTPPPTKKQETHNWKIVDIEILLNKMMFRSLQEADLKVDKMVKAIIASENQSFPNVFGQKLSLEEDLSTENLIQKNPINEVPRVLAIDEIVKDVLEGASNICQAEIPTRDRQEDFGDDLAVDYVSKHREDLASNINLSDEGAVLPIPNVTKEVEDRSEVFSPITKFKIDLKEQFEELEQDLLEEKNEEIIAKYYLSRICQNIEKEFIEKMVLMTCTPNFLKKISFSKDGRIYMKGTNMMKCWIETVTTKFYSRTGIKKEELDKKIAKTIQDTIRRIKNTTSNK